MTKTCPHCKSSDLDVDGSRGNTVCMNCGSVLEENTIVSEVTIQENADGSSSVVGQFVSSEGSYNPHLAGFQYGVGKESRQVTLDKGKQSIRDLAALLKLNKHCVDTAYNFFKMAISKRLSRGRRISHIVAACLYMTCRTEATPHMLLDFSDVTQVNVFTLGKVFLLLAKELHINLPVLDPCMYITRFSHRLDFGDKTHDVSVTAMRLVSRMKRDWIHTGRRPSGLCGAALLVAARLHGFNCELNDVVKVVKIGHETIRKRLSEFESTPSSQLTINEFMNIDLEAEHDPPAFYNGRIKPKIQQLEAEAGGMVNIESEIGKLSHEIDGQLAQNIPENHTSRKNANSNSKRALPNVDDTETDPDLRVSASFVHSEDPQVLAETFLSPPRPTKPLPSKEPISDAETPRKFLGPLPTVQSLGLTPLIKERTNRKRSRSDDGELDLDGIDDEEIEKLLLTPRESEIKSRIWNLEFDDFLKEMEAKRAKRLEEEKKKGKPPRKSRPKRKEYYSESKTAGEAIEKLVSRQRLSNKIDYEALRKATAEDDPPAKKDNEQTTLFHLTPFIEPEQLTSVEISPAKLPSDPKKIRNEACLDPTAQEEPEVSKSEVLEVVEEDCKTEIRPATHEEEDYEEEEEDFDDTACVSASQLMQQAGMSTAGCDEYGYDGDDYY